MTCLRFANDPQLSSSSASWSVKHQHEPPCSSDRCLFHHVKRCNGKNKFLHQTVSGIHRIFSCPVYENRLTVWMHVLSFIVIQHSDNTITPVHDSLSISFTIFNHLVEEYFWSKPLRRETPKARYTLFSLHTATSSGDVRVKFFATNKTVKPRHSVMDVCPWDGFHHLISNLNIVGLIIPPSFSDRQQKSITKNFQTIRIFGARTLFCTIVQGNWARVAHWAWPFNFIKISGWYHRCFNRAYAARISDFRALTLVTALLSSVKLLLR